MKLRTLLSKEVLFRSQAEHGGLAHQVIGIGEQSEQGGTGLPSLLAATHDAADGLTFLLNRYDFRRDPCPPLGTMERSSQRAWHDKNL